MFDDHNSMAGTIDCPSTTNGPIPSIAPIKSHPRSGDYSVNVPDHWRAKSGAHLSNEVLHLRVAGNIFAPKILVLGGISATRFVADNGDCQKAWWPNIVRVGGAIDSYQNCIIGFDYPSGSPDKAIDLCPADIADLLAIALDQAGIRKLDAIIGASFGGMVGLSFARKFPKRIDRLCVICSAHEPNIMAQSRRIIQRRIVEFAIASGNEQEGVALARQLAMTTYRSGGEFEKRFSPNLDAANNVGAYLEARGQDYASNVSAARFLTLSAAIDRHHEDPSSIKTPVFVIGVDTDDVTPIADCKTFHRQLAGPKAFAEISSPFGHDAFLKETDIIGSHLSDFLNKDLIMTDATNIRAARRHPETITATAGVANDAAYSSVAPPLHLSATYGWKSPTDKPQYDYARSGNPTRAALEEALAELEGAERGVVTATGMAAVDLPFNLVSPGQTIIAPHDCYGGTHRLLTARAKRGDFLVEFIDQNDPAALDAAFARRPKLCLIETPSNPLLRITDIKAIVQRAKKTGTVTVVDNTFLSPALQNPIALGANVVVHSTTKYINGHSDVVGGAVLCADKALGDELAWWANCTGVTGAPFDSYLTLRGLRTLYTRIERQQETAGNFADALVYDTRIKQIYYPGLKSHPGHEIAKRQQKGFGAMLSVEFSEEIDVVALLENLNIFTIAESLGGFESLVCIPACMTHAGMEPAAREKAGISDRLVRFSIGLEHKSDLIKDITNALDAISRSTFNETKIAV